MQEVAHLGDELVVIGHGQMLFSGTPQQLSEHAHESDLEEAFIKLIEREEIP
jgi:sodium transport system ATP-binding protein